MASSPANSRLNGRFHLSFNLNPRLIANDHSNLDGPEDFVRTGYRRVGALGCCPENNF